jgi:beta-glucosidase-like glycosyl hydrolase
MKRKIARLVMTGLSSREGDDAVAQYHRLRGEIVDLGVGGFIVFGGNVDSTPEVIGDLAEISPHPLIVASDLERGLGQQLEGGTVFPSQMALGAGGVADLAFAQGWVTAIEARAVGINLVFSPVADVLSDPANPIIGTRAYGGAALPVADLASAFIQGCQAWGVGATAKHFPGHGATRLDSHIELPVVDADRATLEERDLVPFRAAVEAGARAVMTAHVAYPALAGPDVPATLSGEILDGVLRRGLGFDGLIVTDALVMGAIVRALGPGEAAVRAIEAGCDVLLASEDPVAAIDAVHAAVLSGRLSAERIERSLARVDAFHDWARGCDEPEGPADGLRPDVSCMLEEQRAGEAGARTEGSSSHNAVALEIARRGVTLLRDAGLVPCDPASYRPSRAAAFALVEDARRVNMLWLRSEIDARIPGLEILVADEATTDEAAAGLEAAARAADCIMVAVFDDIAAWRGRAGPSERLASMLDRLAAACPRTVVLAFAGPGFLARVPESCTLVCCYDGSPACQTAAVEALFGDSPMKGRLPVAVPPAFAAGHRAR